MKEPIAAKLLALLDDLKALDVRLFDLSSAQLCFETAIIASGSSNNHVRGIADKLAEKYKPLGQEGTKANNWVLLDFGVVIVHIFYEQLRADYNLEALYQSWIENSQNFARLAE